MKLLYVEIEHNGRRKKYKCNSFLKNFIAFLLSPSTGLKLVDMEGVKRSPTPEFYLRYSRYCKGGGWTRCRFDWVTTTGSKITNISFLAPEGDSSYGILIGSSNNPFSYDDYKLYQQYYHSDTEVYYHATVHSKEDNILQIRRSFENKSASDIVVEEIGLAIKYDGKYYLLIRDLVPYTIPPGETISVRYYVEI